MNIVADENVDGQIIERLRTDGHSVQFIAELDPGIDDEAVLFKSRDSNAVLLTADKDFGELVFRQGLVHTGVVLIRLAGVSKPIWSPGRLLNMAKSCVADSRFYPQARYGLEIQRN